MVEDAHRLLESDPLPTAYSARPLTAVEIDNHPDGPRIWATIMQLRELWGYEPGFVPKRS